MDAIRDTLQTLWVNSGLPGLWQVVELWLPSWLALDLRQLIFVIATPFFIGVAVWEYLRIKDDPQLMDKREAVRNFLLGAGYQTTELLFAGLIAFPVYALAWHHRLFDWQLSWVSVLVTFIGVEFCFYWMHRLSHEVRWFWAAHVVHHSSERMNFSTAMRQNATNIFNGNWLFYIPLAWLGLNPVWIGVAFALSLVYQFFIHTTLVKKLPAAIEFFFNTPSHHRVHHGKNPGYIDTNYGGVLIIWDRLFGTFVEEKDGEDIAYGVTEPPTSNNLLHLWTHEYSNLLRDMKRAPWREKLLHLVMPPGWKRDRVAPQRQQEEVS